MRRADRARLKNLAAAAGHAVQPRFAHADRERACRNAGGNAGVSGGGNTDPALDLCIRLARACAVLTRWLDNKLSGVHGLSFSDFMVLYSLDSADGQRLRRIDRAERIGMTASGAWLLLLLPHSLSASSRSTSAQAVSWWHPSF